jgi:DNA-binding response OmpR family regulator
MIKVLIVEDDEDLGNILKQYLELHGFSANRMSDETEARTALKTSVYNIAILDVMLPKEDGFELTLHHKKLYSQLPFLFVTARKLKEDIIYGLKLGADDYIIKPFDADELILRIQYILKRKSKKNTYALGTYSFEPQNQLLRYNETEKLLTEKESKLLEYLFLNKDQLIKREEILQLFWKESDFFSGRSLDVFISRFRKYLAHDPNIVLESVRGVGFRFKMP